MPTRLLVPNPHPVEESRQLAEAIADLHYVLSIIVENGTYLLPGEAIAEMESAWAESDASFRSLVEQLTDTVADPRRSSVSREESRRKPRNRPPLAFDLLVERELIGPAGKAKRSLLVRLRDRFFMYWNSEPRTERKIAKAREAGADCLEFGATLVSSIPGYEQVVEVLSLGSRLLGIRAKRAV